MKKELTVAVVAIVIIAVILVLSFSLTGKVTEKSTIKIGVMTSLSGDAALWGQEIRRGIDLAYEEYQTQKKLPLELIYEDDKCDPKEALNVVHKLIEIDGTKIIFGTLCSSVTLAAAPITEEKRAILFSVGATSPKITDAGDYVFRIWPSDAYEGKVLAEFVEKNLSIKSVGILYINNDYGVDLSNVFIKEFISNGGQTKSVESFDINVKDFRTQLLKIKEANPEAVYFIANPGEGPIIIKQIREMGFNQTILANGPLVETEEIRQMGKDADGIIYAFPRMDASSSFKEKYLKKYDKEVTMLVGAALTYDATNILFDKINICEINTTCIRDQLYQTQNYQGAAGPTSFDENGDVIKPFVIKTMRNGTFVTIG